MPAAGRVPVGAGTLEGRPRAAADGVEVHAVMARREPRRLNPHLEARPVHVDHRARDERAVGLALGPYFAGKMADVTQSLSAGVFWLYVMPPFTLVALYVGSRRIADLEATKVERARAAGEPI